MDKKAKMKKLRNDLLLVGIIIAVTLVVFGIFKLTMHDGRTVVVTVDGRKVYSFSLGDDVRQVITTSGGEQNVLIIKDGRAFVESATCPDKICVRHRPVSKSGETIVCLPHKLVVSVENGGGA